MLQRLVPVCLAAVLLATACGSTDPATPTTNAGAGGIPRESSLAGELRSAMLESRNRPAAPRRDPNETAEAHLHSVVRFVLTSPDPGDSTHEGQDERTKQATECYADSFVGTLSEDRSEDVSTALDQHADEYGHFQDGIPLDVLSDVELDELFVNAAHCVDSIFEDRAEQFTSALSGLDPASDSGISLASSLEACLTDLEGNADFKRSLLEEALFFSPAAEQLHVGTIFDTCGESFFVPTLVELFVVQDRIEREAAECIAPRLLELISNFAPVLLFGDPDDLDGGRRSLVSFEALSIYQECGAEDWLR